MLWIMSRSFLFPNFVLSIILVKLKLSSRTFVVHHCIFCEFRSGILFLTADEQSAFVVWLLHFCCQSLLQIVDCDIFNALRRCHALCSVISSFFLVSVWFLCLSGHSKLVMPRVFAVPLTDFPFFLSFKMSCFPPNGTLSDLHVCLSFLTTNAG